MSDNIKVVIRVRPLIQRETDHRQDVLWSAEDNKVWQNDKSSHPYIFDRVFAQSTTTTDVYQETAQPIVEAAMKGFNGTIFAYGQTASGKTFTMMGNESNPGIIPRAVADIFNSIENVLDREFLVRVSYLEIYNEVVCDLLGDPRKHLDVREDTDGNIFVNNLKEEMVINPEQIMGLMKKGEANRHFGRTNMNERSSRSHTIFRVIIESRERSDGRDSVDGAVMVSHLNLVDLAGSEKAKQTGATGARLMEGGFINKSLFSLGQVISQLSDNAPFINYRDSRLTRILQNALGGNSKTSIICNMTPAAIEETHSTLRFATSAKRIKNKPVQNEVLSEAAMLQRYKIEMQKLQKELDSLKKADVNVMREENVELLQRLAETEESKAQQQEKMKALHDLIIVSSRIKDDTTKAKKKRRETWCPGKDRMSLAPAMLRNFGLPRQRYPSMEDGMASPRPRKSEPYGGLMEKMSKLDEEMESESPQQNPAKKRRCSSDLPGKVSFSDSIFQDGDSWNPKETADSGVQTEEKWSKDSNAQSKVNIEVELLEAELQQRDQHIAEKQCTIEELRTQLVSKDDEIVMLNKTIDDKLEQQLYTEGSTAQSHDKVEELEQKLADAHSRQQEAIELSTGMMTEVERAQSELTKEIKLRTQYEEQLGQLQMTHESLCQQYRAKEEEFKELQEFTEYERELKDESLMEKQYGSEKLDELKSKIEDLEKTKSDSESLLIETQKALATASDEKKLLDQELVEIKKQLQTLQNDKNDFGSYLDLERSKFLRRESELKEQLEKLYTKEGEEPSSLPETSICDKLVQAQVETLQQEVASLQAQLRGQDSSSFAPESMASIEIDQLKTRLSQIEEEKNDLEEQVALLQAQVECQEAPSSAPESLASIEIDQLQTKLSQIEEENANLNMQVASLKVTLESQDVPSEACESMADIELEQLRARVSQLEDQKADLETQMESMSQATASEELEQCRSELEDAYIKVTELEADLEEKQEKVQNLEAHVCDQPDLSDLISRDLLVSLETKLEALQEEMDQIISDKQTATEKVEVLESELLEVKEELSVKEMKVNDLETKLQSASKDFDFESGQQLKNERKAYEDLEAKYDKLSTETSQTKGQLLSGTNRDMDQQRRIDSLEKSQRELIGNFSQAQHEYQHTIEDLNNKVTELSHQVQKAKSDVELAEHKMKKTEEEKESLKQELRTLEDIRINNEAVQRNQGYIDPEKMADRIKKLSCSLELTNQRLQKAESENKKLRGAGDKADDAIFERNNLQRQLREVEHSLGQKTEEISRLQQRYGSSHTITADLKLQLDNLQQQLQKTQADRDNALDRERSMSEEHSHLGEQKSKLEQEMRALTSQMAHIQKEIKEIKERNEDLEIQLSQQVSSDVIDDIKQAHQTEMQSKMAALRQEEEQHHLAMLEKKLAEEKEKYEEDFETKICQLRDAAMQKLEEEKCVEKERSLEEVNKTREEYERQMAALEKSHAQRLEELEAAHAAAMEHAGEDMSAQYQEMKAKVAQLENSHSNMDVVLEKKEAEKEALEKQYEENIRLLVQEREEVEKLHTQKVEGLITEHQAAIKELEAAYKTQLEQKDAKYHELVASQDGENSSQQAIVQHYEEELSLLHEQHEQKLAVKQYEIEAKTEEISVKVQEYEALKNKLLEKDQELVRVAADLDSKETQLERLLNEVNGKQKVIDSLSEEINALNEAKLNSVNNEELEILKLEIKVKEEEMDSLKKELADANTSIENALSELERTKQLLEEKEGTLSACEGYSIEKGELETQIIELKLERDEQIAMTETLENQISVKESEIELLRLELSSEVEKQQEQLAQKDGELSVKDLAMEELRSDVEKLQDHLAERDSQLSAKDLTMDELSGEVGKLQEELVQKEKELSAKELALEELRISQSAGTGSSEELQKIQSTLAEKDAKLEQASDDLENVKLELDEAQNNVQLIKSEMELKDMDLEKMKDDLERQTKEGDILKTKLTKLEQEFEEANKANQDLRDRLAEVNEKLSEESSEAEDASQATLVLQEQIAELSGALEIKTEQVQVLQECIEEANNEVTELRKETDTLKQLNKNLKKQSHSEDSQAHLGEIEKLTKMLAEQKADYEETIAHREQCCDEADAELDEAKGEVYDLTQKLAAAQKATSDPDEIKKLKSELQQQKEDYEEIISDRERCCDEADAELEQAKSELEDLREKLAVAQKTGHGSASYSIVMAHAEEVAQLKKACNDSEHKLETTRRQVKELQEKLERALERRGGHPGLAPNVALLQEEKHALERKLADTNMKLAGLQWELKKEAEPLKDKIKSLTKYNDELRGHNHQLTGELRKMKAEVQQRDGSFMCPQCSGSSGTASDSGVINSLKVFKLESNIGALEREVKALKTQLHEKDRALQTSKLLETDLKQKYTMLEMKNKKYKRYYGKTLTEEDREALKDMVNSPKATHSSKDATVGQKKDSKPKFFSDYLVADSEDPTKDEDPSQCQTQ